MNILKDYELNWNEWCNLPLAEKNKILDDIFDEGNTLAEVVKACHAQGAKEVLTAVEAHHAADPSEENKAVLEQARDLVDAAGEKLAVARKTFKADGKGVVVPARPSGKPKKTDVEGVAGGGGKRESVPFSNVVVSAS